MIKNIFFVPGISLSNSITYSRGGGKGGGRGGGCINYSPCEWMNTTSVFDKGSIPVWRVVIILWAFRISNYSFKNHLTNVSVSKHIVWYENKFLCQIIDWNMAAKLFSGYGILNFVNMTLSSRVQTYCTRLWFIIIIICHIYSNRKKQHLLWHKTVLGHINNKQFLEGATSSRASAHNMDPQLRMHTYRVCAKARLW